ncbi:hypothetical protein DMA12_07800 [Amycolatopsis balhimycina DSM 5908]|uniref:Uncharacterized protein n=1 Tax=Amycolatopsis balhimycina DSM 5908 TaxID=1081091 RepID=A0A428WXP5_AMYBA|nr:hypothetical protein [Amycolatopsis balhimycina]RSM47862.1 hypothetical protein DMA12_07800 [Amycolatopsis balhimycina DSM 5908]
MQLELLVPRERPHPRRPVPTLSPISESEFAETHRRSLHLAVEAGVGIAAGSDLAPRPHVDLATELRLLAAVLGDAAALKAAASSRACARTSCCSTARTST